LLSTTIRKGRGSLKLAPKILEIDPATTTERIKNFIKDFVEKTEAKGVVLGLSGGIDSSTIAALSALALGGEKVIGLILPEDETYNRTDIEHAKLVAQKFHLKTVEIDITPVLEAYYKTLPIFDDKERMSKGNIKARVRMIYLYYYANKLNLLVCGSSDKSETMMGYFTKWGDVAADVSPIMDLYKTQVRQLAKHIGIPNEIIAKPSSPNLWRGQLAEKELGIKYETLDLVLYGLEHFIATQEIANQLNLDIQLVESIKKRWMAMEHKRQMPLSLKLAYRTVGKDFRLPYTI
jgi:NAD+ synthase